MTAKKREAPGAIESLRRANRILYGDGNAIEPAEETIDSIVDRLSGDPVAPPRPAVHDTVFIQNFIRTCSPLLRRMAEAKVIEAEVIECAHGRPAVLDLSPGTGILDPSEPPPEGLAAGIRLWVAPVESSPTAASGDPSRVLCSVRIASGHRALAVVESMWAGQLWVQGMAVEHRTGEGWIIDIGGFKAALPEEESGDADLPMNVPLKFAILHYDPSVFCVILSRKKFLAAQHSLQQTGARRRIRPGEILEGRVSAVSASNAWVDLGGTRAELSGEDAGYGPPRDNLAALQVGQSIRVFVLEVSDDKISVGLRQLEPDPWVFVKKSLLPGARLEAVVRAIYADRVKVELTEGIVGEILWKEAGWMIQDSSELDQFFKVGETVAVVCLAVQRESARVILSVKSLQTDPLPEIMRRYTVARRCDVRIASCTDARARVVTDEGFVGVILPDDLSWNGPVSPAHFFHSSNDAPAGRHITAEVLSVDPATRLIRFGVKQVKPDPFLLLVKEIEIEKIYDGRVVKIISVGALIEIRKGLVGLLRKTDYVADEPPPAEGQTLKVMVTAIQAQQRRITLSRRAVVEMEERKEMQPFLTSGHDERKVPMKDVVQGDLLKRLFQKRDP